MNFYAYVMNNPLRWVDPSGHHHNGACHGIADYPHPVCPGVDVDVTPDPQLPYFPFFPPNYPGGGGERSPQPPKGTPDKQRQALQDGLRDATRRLEKDKCGAFFGGQGLDRLRATNYRFLPFTNQPRATAGVLSDFMVNINPNGAFFSGPPKPIMYGRVWDLTSFRGLLLLHELGHQLDSVTGFRADWDNQRLNDAQSQRVATACY